MQHSPGPDNFAFLCDDLGRVRQCLDSGGLFNELSPGRPWVGELLPPQDEDFLPAFLKSVLEQGSAAEQAVPVVIGVARQVVNLSGWRVGADVLIYGELATQRPDTPTVAPTPEVRAMSAGHALGEAEFDDITRLNNELLNTQRDLYKKNEALTRLHRQKNQALGTVAHDLRNPLALIKMQSDFLLGQQPAGTQRDMIESIREQSQLMLTIVNDLLDTAAIESGQFTLRLSPVGLYELVARNVRHNAMLAGGRGVDVIMDAACSDEFEVIVDAAKLEQVLNNLIHNAVKYSTAGSHVRVTLAPTDRWYQIAVHDNGPGVSDKDRQAIFAAFARGEQPASESDHSIGLGLAIAKRIVEAHAGRIELASHAGEGACFVVSMPVDPGNVTGPPPAGHLAGQETTQPASRPAAGKRFLVVDDSTGAARMLGRMLQLVTADEFDIARDMDSALAMVDEVRPRLVFMDIELPGPSGHEVARTIRERWRDDPIRIVAVTGHSSEHLQDLGDASVFDAVLSKPVSIEDLRAVTERFA